MSALDRVNHLNTGLIVASGVAAFFLPFELFIFSYALLGPLHYLTEISWLHDRQYFSHGRFAALPLLLLALATAHGPEMKATSWTFFHDPTMAAFFAAFALAFLREPILRWITVMACVWLAKPLVGEFTLPFFGIYLATLVHVFCFTWLFVLHGALKNRSASAFLSLLILTVTAVAMLALPVPPSLAVSDYFLNAVNAFGKLHLEFTRLLGWDPRSPRTTAAMRFIAFAYTYHYLNWFSKTAVIGWHEVSRKRIGSIAIGYVLFAGLYLYDYKVGVQALLFVSLGHVFLEFPLNLRTVWGIAQEVPRLAKRQARAEIRSTFKEKKRRTG